MKQQTFACQIVIAHHEGNIFSQNNAESGRWELEKVQKRVILVWSSSLDGFCMSNLEFRLSNEPQVHSDRFKHFLKKLCRQPDAKEQALPHSLKRSSCRNTPLESMKLFQKDVVVVKHP